MRCTYIELQQSSHCTQYTGPGNRMAGVTCLSDTQKDGVQRAGQCHVPLNLRSAAPTGAQNRYLQTARYCNVPHDGSWSSGRIKAVLKKFIV